MMGIVWGLPVAPALYVFDWLTSFGPGDRSWPDLFLTGFAASIAVITWGLLLLVLSGSLQFLIRLRFEGRIVAPLSSTTTIRWAICGLLHRSTQPFLVHVVPSFFANAYYRLGGCKIGKNVNINSVKINDPSLVELGDNVVVGGGATMNGHLVEKGNIVLERIQLEKTQLSVRIQWLVQVQKLVKIVSLVIVPFYLSASRFQTERYGWVFPHDRLSTVTLILPNEKHTRKFQTDLSQSNVFVDASRSQESQSIRIKRMHCLN
ncbi:MAG: hypothetical protein MKZ54_07065 [Candidatus Poseidoniaceae archaeon]|nr:hypothetical protein [Candidatus Poseidoniaceae archaeon]